MSLFCTSDNYSQVYKVMFNDYYIPRIEKISTGKYTVGDEDDAVSKICNLCVILKNAYFV